MTPARCRTILVLAVLLVFGRLLWCDFTWWDDWMTVHQNKYMQHVSADTFTFNWLHSSASIYIPLTYTVWGLISMVAQVPVDDAGITLNPTFFHLTNMLVHAGGALAAFGLLRRLVKNDTAALLGALLWAVHPVQVESVGWISGLKDVLSGTLVLGSLLLYVGWRQDGGRRRIVLSAFVYLLAMLAKPSAFTMPLLVVVIDRLLLHTPWRKIAVALVPFAVLTLPIAYIAKQSQPAPSSIAPVWMRPLMAGDSLAFYAVKIVAPLQLTFDYGRNVRWFMNSPELYYGWLLPAAIAGLTWLAYARARRAGRPLSALPLAGLLICVLAPVHVLGLVRFDFQTISVVADHYLYVALFGVGVLLAWAVLRWPKTAVPAAAVVAAYGVRAALQTPVWQNELTLMTHATRVNPQSWTAYTNLAVLANKAGDFELERQYLETGLRIRPDDPTLFIGLIVFYSNHHDWDRAELYARMLIRFYNQYWAADYHNYGQAYYKIIDSFFSTGNLELTEKYLNEALALDPADQRLLAFKERIQWKRAADAAKTPATRPAPTTTRPAP